MHLAFDGRSNTFYELLKFYSVSLFTRAEPLRHVNLRVIISFAEHEFIVAPSEGIVEDGNRMQINVRVAALSLTGGRTVEVPNRQLWRI